MAGQNTTGQGTVNDYEIGRGKVFISALASSLPTSWRFLGNCPSFSISAETENLEHVSSQEGTRTVDKDVVVQKKLSISFQIDEINFQNLALFFSGTSTAAALTNPAVAGIAKITDYVASVALGVWYDIQSLAITSLGVRAYDIAKANLTLEEGATPLVIDTDYLVDEKNGRFFLLSTASNISAGDGLDLTLAADAGAVSPDEVKALTTTSALSAIKFIGINPADNDKETEYQVHQVQLKGDGDFELVGDDWKQMGFSGTMEKNAIADPDSPYITTRVHANS